MLRGRSRYPSFHDQLLPAVNETCLAAQIRAFCNISVSGGNPHSGCCGALPALPSATRDLLEDVNTAVRELGTDSYVNPTSGGLTQADNDLPFRTADAKRFKSNFHAWQGFSDSFFFGFTGSAQSNLYLYGIDIHFCPWEVFTASGKCKDCLKDRDLCLCPRPDGTPETKGKSYRRIAIEILAVHRLLLDDEGYKEHLEIIKPYYRDPFPYLDEFYRKREDIYAKLLETYSCYLSLVSSTKPIRALDSDRGVRCSGVFSQTAKEIYETYSRLWHKLNDQKTNVPLLFFNFEWDVLETIWQLDEDRSEELVEYPEIKSLFERIRSLSSCTFQGPGYLKAQFLDQHITRKQEYRQSKLGLDYRMDMTSFPHWNLYLLMQIGMLYNAALMKQVTWLLGPVNKVRLFPHLLALQPVRIEMHDGKDVPLYMLVVAIFLEMTESRST